jgi:hypothetical protein
MGPACCQRGENRDLLIHSAIPIYKKESHIKGSRCCRCVDLQRARNLLAINAACLVKLINLIARVSA